MAQVTSWTVGKTLCSIFFQVQQANLAIQAHKDRRDPQVLLVSQVSKACPAIQAHMECLVIRDNQVLMDLKDSRDHQDILVCESIFNIGFTG
jgi:hypothetical protein